MGIHTAGWGGLGMLLLIVCVVIPSIRWSIWGAQWGMRHGPRIGRRYARQWGVDLDFDDDERPRRGRRQELADLRAELESRLSDVDSLTNRVAELENRLDFTERLLAQRSEVGTTPSQAEQ